jgi:hypothetical protein
MNRMQLSPSWIAKHKSTHHHEVSPLEETRLLMKKAIEGHLECMREFGYAIPKPTTVAEEVEIPV